MAEARRSDAARGGTKVGAHEVEEALEWMIVTIESDERGCSVLRGKDTNAFRRLSRRGPLVPPRNPNRISWERAEVTGNEAIPASRVKRPPFRGLQVILGPSCISRSSEFPGAEVLKRSKWPAIAQQLREPRIRRFSRAQRRIHLEGGSSGSLGFLSVLNTADLQIPTQIPSSIKSSREVWTEPDFQSTRGVGFR